MQKQFYNIVYIIKVFYKTSNVDFIIRNISHFNKLNKIFIVVNLADFIYDKTNIEQLKKTYQNVKIMKCTTYRTKFDPHVICSVTNSLNYILENMDFEYFVLSHDSEVYIKIVNMEIIKNNMIKCKKNDFDKNAIIKRITRDNDEYFWWKRFIQLENVFNYFMENEIEPLVNVCPAMTLSKESVLKIMKNLNDICNNEYLNSEKRVLLDEIVYCSFLTYHSCEYFNSNYTYWTNDKREALKSEEVTLKELKKDLVNNNDKLKNVFSIKKSYKSVCDFVEKELMRE